MISVMRTRQFGRFYVDGMFFNRMLLGEGLNLFTGMLVLDVRDDFQSDRREYRGVHAQFRPIEQGEMIPLYEAVFKVGEIAPTWYEVESLGTVAAADVDDAYRAAIKKLRAEPVKKWWRKS